MYKLIVATALLFSPNLFAQSENQARQDFYAANAKQCKNLNSTNEVRWVNLDRHYESVKNKSTPLNGLVAMSYVGFETSFYFEGNVYPHQILCYAEKTFTEVDTLNSKIVIRVDPRVRFSVYVEPAEQSPGQPRSFGTNDLGFDLPQVEQTYRNIDLAITHSTILTPDQFELYKLYELEVVAPNVRSFRPDLGEDSLVMFPRGVDSVTKNPSIDFVGISKSKMSRQELDGFMAWLKKTYPR